jgi:hypothetical protein
VFIKRKTINLLIQLDQCVSYLSLNKLNRAQKALEYLCNVKKEKSCEWYSCATRTQEMHVLSILMNPAESRTSTYQDLLNRMIYGHQTGVFHSRHTGDYK